MISPAAEFKRGWPTLIGCFVGIASGVSSTYFYSLGIFIKPMAAEFGWSRGAASLGALCGIGGAALMAVPTGRLVDRFGSVPVGIGSLLMLALWFAALGWMTRDLGSFLAASALLSLLTAGSSPLSFTRPVVAAFDRHRGLALGMVLAATGMGAILVPQLLTPYVAHHGWRTGYLAMALIVAAASLPAWWFLAGANRLSAQRPPPIALGVLMADPAVRLLGLIFFLAAIAILGTVVQFVPMLSDWGLPPARAGAAASLIGAAAIGGRVVVGALLDRLGPQRVTTGLFSFAAFGLALLVWRGVTLVPFGALIIGFAVGAEVDLVAFCVARFFARSVYGQVYGAIYAIFLVGGAIGPPLSGHLHDLSGDYRLSLMVMAGLSLISALIASRISLLAPIRYDMP